MQYIYSYALVFIVSTMYILCLVYTLGMNNEEIGYSLALEEYEEKEKVKRETKEDLEYSLMMEDGN